MTKKVVFVCTHNAGKSRVAEGYLKKVAGERFDVLSAGTEPSDSPNPAAVEAAREAGIDLRPGPGVRISEDMTSDADVIVTFGCGVDGLAADASVEDWKLVDESGQPLKDYDAIRDAITKRVDDLITRLDEN